jgi:hypothetical protein
MNKRKTEIHQITNYPWDGEVQISVTPEKQTEFSLFLRIPGWANGQPVPGNTYFYSDHQSGEISISVNGLPADYKLVNGYAMIRKTWKKGDVVQLSLPMPVRRIAAIDEVKENRNRVAFQRGPLVYCFEHTDNQGKVFNITIPDPVSFTAEYKPIIMNGIVVIQAETPVATISENGLSISTSMKKITGIPYYSWANRGEGQMQVWVPRKITDIRLLTE